ncbi:aldehyde dehydrogenase family 3 member B1-like isoform X2 [Dreissena polymorpha]|uniref:Aldehyde dehydrogenase n=2 Tax=Dreissena polymorpha TaxID=45954 RepID=A0A9D4G2T0_DREPO|nr:aldehyde dehydrogenase family 3 member B1-like isoform X2 [Dreissena polymorpha]KAH3806522.1 hypothetical protein DPMN_134845 [Dreissena polymorpha]
MESFEKINQNIRTVFRSGRTKSLEWRRAQLMSLLKMLDVNREKFSQVLKEDLNKCKSEGLLFEIDFTRNALVDSINKLKKWTTPKKAKKGLLYTMDKAYIRKEPFGVALIIGAWNYPVQLTILPMVGAIAAGNCVVLKPSEISLNTAALLEELVPKYLDQEAVQVVNGGIQETTALLKEKWDYIFYTGNSMVGKIVMKAAAEHLTPITLELGGKSPVYVDEGVDLGIVANRIMWGKCTNAGQTCVAPDYVMCSKTTQEALTEAIKQTLQNFYPDGPAKSPDFCRIVSDKHYQRVKKCIQGGGTVAVGGDVKDEERYVSPTVLVDVKFSDSIMQDEIFGPILPIIPVENEDVAINFINTGPIGNTPLTLYVFSSNTELRNKIMKETNSGSVCFNDTLSQCNLPSLPFGGVGNSGMGAYHGKYSFDTFSHKRSILERELKMEGMNDARYPPHTDDKYAKAAWFLGSGKQPKTGWFW